MLRTSIVRPSGRVRSVDQVLGGAHTIPNDFLIRIAVANFTALDEQADVVVKAGPARQEWVWYVEQFLKVSVPSADAQISIEHHHAVAHVLESDAEFLLPPRQLAQQTRVLHSDDGLVGKGFDQFDLPRREGTRREALQNEDPNQVALATQKHA